MKKYFYLLLILSTMICFSCSSSDNDNSEENEINKSYNSTKLNIVGQWVMTDYYISQTTNAYEKLGWNNASWYTYNFKTDGTATYYFSSAKDTRIFKSYSISLKYPYTYGYHEYTDYYQYKNGIVLLEMKYDYTNTATGEIKEYTDDYIAEIKSDGMLYLYSTGNGIGLMGEPQYRFKKI